MKDAPRRGHIFLQEHGSPIWYRNIFIKEIAPEPSAKPKADKTPVRLP